MGTRFTIPGRAGGTVANADIEAVDGGAIPVHGREPVRTILLVDDDADVANAVAQALDREGFALHWAASAEVALEHLKGGRVPGLILLDHRMPGMTGARLLGVLNADPALRGIPVVLLSGDPIGLEKAKALGAEAAIEKPFDAAALVAAVNAYYRAS